MIKAIRKSKYTFVNFLKNTKISKDASKDDSGATAIEYGLLAAILAVGIIAGASGMGSTITNMWTDIATDVGAS